MPRSMTAYGRHAVVTPAGTLAWELRGVNHRFLDVQTRLPEALRSAEGAVRERVRARLHRGRIELSLHLGPNAAGAAPLLLDEALLGRLGEALGRLGRHVDDVAAVDPLALLQYPGVIRREEPDSGALSEAALAALDRALDDFVATREREGRATGAVLARCTAALATRAREIAARRPDVVARQRTRLLERLAGLGVTLDSVGGEALRAEAGRTAAGRPDPLRLEQELAIQAQRLDIDEELERLGQHLREFDAALGRDGPIGRRLDFLAQELGREANTLGAKAADGATAAAVVELKVLIEQLREQVQNVE